MVGRVGCILGSSRSINQMNTMVMEDFIIPYQPLLLLLLEP